jgi:allantoicase
MIGDVFDLASEAVGGSVMAANDEFFAPKENLVMTATPVWREDVYTDHGKWMDGWETRRRREAGSDWAIVRLGVPGVADRVEIDTAFFAGNYPESAEVLGTGVGDRDIDDLAGRDEWWEPLVAKSRLAGDHVNVFPVTNPHRITHVKLVIHPDGGVARLRVVGTAIPERRHVAGDVDLFSAAAPEVEVSSLYVGSAVVASSDDFFGKPARMLLPTASAGMYDGWETRRRRGPGNDWAVIRLGIAGVARRFVVDTTHFKGNAPGWVSIHGCLTDDAVPPPQADWLELVPRTAVAADTVNQLPASVEALVSHLRLDIHPDGGVARFKVFGSPHPEAREAARITYLNSLSHPAADSFFTTACGSRAWVNAMLAGLPYPRTADVLGAADGAFNGLGEVDWLEAFAAHPRIGGGHGGQDADGEAMSAAEQAAVTESGDEVRARLATGNEEYEVRHGFRYIVSAAGRSGDELLDLLERRLRNDRASELAEAAAQQRSITRRRLQWLLCAAGGED